MQTELKRMLTGRTFLAAWAIACISLFLGQTYPDLKKVLDCGTFIQLLEASLKSRFVSFTLPVAAILTEEEEQIYLPLFQAQMLCTQNGIPMKVSKVLLKIKGKENLEKARELFEGNLS